MELHVGLSREIVAVMRRDRLATAARERLAAEAYLHSRQSQQGVIHGWLARVGSIATRAAQPGHGVQRWMPGLQFRAR